MITYSRDSELLKGRILGSRILDLLDGKSGYPVSFPLFFFGAAVTQQLLSPLDLILVETRSARFYSFLSICYGLIADVDIESEKYRKLGVVRNILGEFSLVTVK